jgi:tetratricopeptide (TPR) repeat protein
MRYRAFLSYSHVDRKWARWLHRALESYKTPRHLKAPDGREIPGRLSPIFRDRAELPSTASLSDAVNEALGESETLIVICSPHAAASRWVNEEIRIFRALGRANKIFCYVVDGEPGSGNDTECFPKALTEPDDLTGLPAEPVAADARPQGDGRNNALLKLVAGILGVGYDAIKQRDLRRRHQKMAAITGGSIAIAAVTALLALNAIIARNEAETRRIQANDLIDFMLGDLQEQLRKIGRLDVFQSVGDKALEYFAAQRDDDDTAYTLSQRARNLRQIGEIRMEQGDLSAALEAFDESLLISEQLANRDSTNAESQISMANSLFYVGYVRWQRGELGQAREYFEKVLPIVDAVSARDPDNTSWLIEKAYAYTNLGRVLELQGALEDALVSYRRVMDINERLVNLDPDNTEWTLELSFAHNNIGKLVAALGRLDEAESHFRRDLDIKNRIYATDRNHNVWRSYVAVSQYYLGQLLLERGAIEESQSLLTAARQHFTFLSEVDPERKRWEVRLANIDRELGKLFWYLGKTPQSADFFDSSVRTLTAVMQDDEGNANWRRELLRSLLVAADFASRRGDFALATGELAATDSHIKFLLEQEPTNLETQELAVYADICAAQVPARDRAEVAAENLQEALRKLDQHFADSSDPRILELQAVALARLGRSDEAEAIYQELQTIGYQSRMKGK